ncbi:MAG: hypothetical protein AAF160_11570 [Pseudomonadota bacterium]
MTTDRDDAENEGGSRREGPKERMRNLRRRRREEGFTELTVWVPADLRPWLRRMAAGFCVAWVGEDPEVTGGTESRPSETGENR